MTEPTPLHPRAASSRATIHRRIFIRDLVVPCAIGVHAHERNGTQRVRINTDLLVRDDGRPLHDNIGNVLSYEAIIDGIRALTESGHINLVETLAERIAALCLDDRRVESVRVRVEKLDVYADAASVGVEIERGRPRE